MSSSLHEGIVEFADSLYGTSGTPLDTTIMRDGPFNGLLHGADSYSQVRVNWMARSSDGITIDTGNDIDAGDQYRIGGPFGEWPLTIRDDGRPYILRVRIAGALDGTPATGSFRVVIAPDSEAWVERDADDDTSGDASTTSTTVSWLTFQSNGTNGAATYLEISAEKARSWLRRVSCFNAAAGGSPREIEQVLVSAHVFGSTTDITNLPVLYGLHIAEHYGPV